MGNNHAFAYFDTYETIFGDFNQNERIYLDLVDRIDSMMNVKTGDVGINEIKNYAIKNNPTPKIGYERLYQARRRVEVAGYQMIPVRSGMALTVLLGAAEASGFLAPLLVADIVTSLPHKWHKYKSKEYLAEAEQNSMLAAQENLKNEVAKIYYNLLTQKALLETLEYEERLLGALADTIKSKHQYGLVGSGDYLKVVRRRFALKSELPQARSLLDLQISEFNQLLGVPHGLVSFSLAHMNKELFPGDIENDVPMLVEGAKKRSYEMKSAYYSWLAAKRQKTSAQWRIFSFDGIGFDHGAKMEGAKSKIRYGEMKIRHLGYVVGNQVRFEHRNLINTIKFANSSHKIALLTRSETLRILGLYRSGRVDLEKLLRTELLFLEDFRKAVISHYKGYSKLDDVERLVLRPIRHEDVTSNPYPPAVQYAEVSATEEHMPTDSHGHIVIDDNTAPEMHYSVYRNQENGKIVYNMTFHEFDLDKIESVVYDFQKFRRKRTNVEDNFALEFDSSREYHKVKVKFQMKNGEVKNKDYDIIFYKDEI